MITKTEKIM